jgi:hypothetical protein
MKRALVCVAIVCMASSANAQQQRDPVKADALFREGQKLLAAGDLAAACPMLADSYALDPALGTLLNLAFCHEKQGRTFTAWTEFRRAAAEATRTEQRERATFAKTRMHELEAKLPHARIEVSNGARVTALRVDGATFDPPLEDVITVAPGTHTIDIDTSTGEHLTQTAAFGSDGTVVVRFASHAAPPPTPPSAPQTDEDPGASRRTLGLGIAGLGVAALSAGTYFGIATFAKKSDADSACAADGCTAQGKRDGDTAHTYATASTILIGTGVVAAAAGLYLFLTAPSARATARF